MMRASFALRCFLFAVLVCGWIVPTRSESKKLWQVYAEAGETAFQEERPSTAEVMLLSAVKEAESEGAHDPWLGKVNYELGDLYSRAGDYGKAESHFLAALRVWEQCHEPEARDTAFCLNQLGLSVSSQGRENEAEHPYNRAIGIFRKLQEPSSVAMVVKNLASSYSAQDKYSEAEKCLEEGLRFVEHSKKKVDEKTVASLVERLAMIYLAQNQVDKAEAEFGQLQSTGEAAKDYAKTLDEHARRNAIQLYSRKRYSEAERLLNGELALLRKQSASPNMATADALNDMANVHYRQRKFKEAETEKRQVIEIAKEYIPTDWAFADVALIQYAEGKGAQAESDFREELDSMKQRRDQSGDDEQREDLSLLIAERLENFAEVYYNEGKKKQSASLYKEALEALGIRDKDIGYDDDHTIAKAKAYIDVLRKLGENAEAREVETRFEQK